jgi:hypothetical protein
MRLVGGLHAREKVSQLVFGKRQSH